MPQTEEMLKFLVKKGKLKDKDWFEILEITRCLLKPHLKNFPLQKLGNVECLRFLRDSPINFVHWNKLSCTQYLEGDYAVAGVDLQGLFFWPQVESYSHSKSNYQELMTENGPKKVYDGKRSFWGLARQGDWVLVTISFHNERNMPIEANDRHKGVLEKADVVRIDEADPKKMKTALEVSPERMWCVLVGSVDKFVRRRRELLKEAQKLQDKMKGMEFLVSLFPEE